MYNFRILIQEMRHLRGSFRIYVLIARSSTCLNTGGVVVAEHQATSRALSSLVQTRFDISLPSFLSQQDCYLLGDVKKNQEKLGEDGHRLLAWGSKALEDGRLSNTHCQRKIQEKTVIPKDPVETVGINKTSLPSPGSNGCFEENPHLKMRIRKPFLFRCILCPKCKRRLGGVLSMEGGDRGAHRHGLSSGVGCCPGVLGTTWLTLGGRAFWRPWCTIQEKPVATRAVPCGTYKAKLT